jgi:uncharacterized protein YtpQ (UPF0354 family)
MRALLRRLFHRRLNRERFVGRVLREFRKAGAEHLNYNESEFSITVGGEDHRAFLNNVFADCRDADEESRQASINHFVATFLNTVSVPTSFASVRQHVLPIVRAHSYNSLFRLHLMAEGNDTSRHDWVWQPLSEGLALGLAYDTEHSLTIVNREMLENWSEPFDVVLRVAKENLRDRTDPNGFVEQQRGVFLGCWNDSYDSSRMLLTEYVYRLSLEGSPVAFLPNRNRLWITGDMDTEGLRRILEAGKESHFKEGHPLSPDLYILAGDIWARYVPEKPVLRELCLSIKRDRDALDYHQQKENLEKLHQKEATDIFVASYSVFERQQDKSQYSICVWSKGVDSLLPKTDRIVFLIDSERADFISVPWDVAISVVQDLMQQQPELLPVRYRVRSFPDEAQLARLKEISQE